MTTLRIEHRTIYTYARPVSFGRHRLVLCPRSGHDLHVRSMKLEIFPAYDLAWARDVFGNSVALVHFLEPADRLEVSSDVLIEREPPFPSKDVHEPWKVPFPVLYDPLETTITSAYQLPSYPDDVEILREWLDHEVPGPDRSDAEGVVISLGEIIRQRVTYQRRNEKGVQTPAQTLRLKSGSCRDMATLLMDAIRILGIASRFASGYLDCPASIAGRASTHAWTEYYLPGLGWRGFDPTIGEPTSLKHVVIGVSNHPRGVMPISGMFSGTSADYREMTVSVKTTRLDGPPLEAVSMSCPETVS
jgi:transglutaminase-like putative cysteine protease